MIVANSVQQYNKWKSWENGEIKNTDMFILAQTYGNEIYGLCNKLGINRDDLTDEQIFKMVSEKIVSPI